MITFREQRVVDDIGLDNTLFFAIWGVPENEWDKVIVEGVDEAVIADIVPMSVPGFDLSKKHRPWRPASPIHGRRPRRALICSRRNGVPNLGLQMTADRLFGITAPAVIGNIGIAEDAATVVNTTVFLGGAAAAILSGGTQNGFIRALAPAATRSGQVVTAGATFTQADQAGRLFAIHKVGLLNAATDVGTGLGAGPASGIFDVIGGNAGSAPFNQPFTIDLTGTTTWSLLMQIQVTFANI